MKIKELGEFGLIEMLARLVAQSAPGGQVHTQGAQGFRLLLGIGDDTAAWHTAPSTELFTTDTMVQGVHFVQDKITWRELGWKVMAVNYSDIAAMGGTPLYSIVTLGLPEDTPVEGIAEMYEGMMEVCREYQGIIVGGDVVRSPILFVTVALTGATKGPLLTRDAASAGDQVAVTGYLGCSAGGLRMLLANQRVDSRVAAHLREAHNRPMPRVAQGSILAQHGVRAAIDVSDGLADDLSKMCRASGVGAVIQADQVLVHPLLKEAFPVDCLALALEGGEDYELLFAAPADVVARLLPQLEVPATVIGEITRDEPGKVTILSRNGSVMSMQKGGWDHFR